MDKPIIEGGASARPLFDTILSDVASSRSREILIPSLIKAEIKPTPSQLSRLDSVVHQAQVVKVDVDGIIAANPGIISAKFGRADLQLLETARMHGLPVVTCNSALRNQITNHPIRPAMYGNLDILVPGQNLPNSAHMLTMVDGLP